MTDVASLNQELPEDMRVFAVQQVKKKFNPRFEADARTYSYTLPTIAFCRYDDQTVMKDYRLPTEKLQLINGLLQQYIGNKNFHNFTTNKKPTDQNAMRIMLELECSPETFIKEQIEFAVIRIHGRSFMMHQIRKMIGLLLAVVREITDATVFERALSTQTVDIPTAPGLGLVLDRVHFNKYNKIFGSTPNRQPLTWDEFQGPLEDFRAKFVHSHIVNKEIEEQSMQFWVEDLLSYSYDVVPEDQIDAIRNRYGEKPEDEEVDSDNNFVSEKPISGDKLTG